MKHLQTYQIFESTIFNEKHIQKIADKASDEMGFWLKGHEQDFEEAEEDRYTIVDEYIDTFFEKFFPNDQDFIQDHREDIIMQIIEELEDDLDLEPSGELALQDEE
jgi:hypothetical protein